MNNKQVILFDLDGTLSDPKIGITKSVQYALAKLGIVENHLDQLEPFIGPPLQVSFQELYGLTEEQINRAIHYYRERFADVGMFENSLYAGIPALLEDLKAQGYQLAIATSKPTVFAEKIVHYFDIAHYFDIVAGSLLDGTRSAKGEVIAFAMDQFSHMTPSAFIMIGDRKHDLIGAHENGIECVGVTYGYGSLEELEKANATYIVHSVNEIKKLLSV
ncbi:HAD family hydrolase [Lysinibacillus piscis]|uniref:Phosphoglycolate phosphatase n=1 Tax=Lysinibacillus piscis TaxID=2518931 RepID=A0ABQ5NG00_9BACI|nr:HAD family hydrolase [Lysinibacillus sp. KH24]GLC87242.1 phosphoglycolate phosphatase [Lysinibacillus sp. KH24]